MRSQTPYPTHINLDFLETIRSFWEKGIFDDYAENHFLIRAINNDVSYFKHFFLRRHITDIDPNAFPWHFIVNLDGKIKNFINRFGSDEIENFFKNQFSAGKSSYMRTPPGKCMLNAGRCACVPAELCTHSA